MIGEASPVPVWHPADHNPVNRHAVSVSTVLHRRCLKFSVPGKEGSTIAKQHETSRANTSHTERVKRILGKLQAVRDQGLECFGSNAHRFQLNPPVSQDQLDEFQSARGISLPEDITCFLITAGEGGAGPDYGIQKLKDWYECDRVSHKDILQRPCPLHPGMSRDDNWEEQFHDCVSPYQGIISIGSRGCSFFTGLIVAGEYRGRVVYLDGDDSPPYVVREPDFLAWYERWLDELLGGYDMFGFGFGLGGDEASLMALLDEPATPEDDRADAVWALRRLPSISSDCRQRVGRLLDDQTAAVRAAACRVVEKFEIPVATEVLIRLLSDESSEVRVAAISACTSLLPDSAGHELTPLLDSDDEESATSAYSALERRGLLPREVLLRLVEWSPHGVIRYFAAHTLKWKGEDEALLVRLLNDDHSQVRFYAVLGLRQIASETSLDAAISLLDRETDKLTVDSILTLLGKVPGSCNAVVLLEWAEKGDDYQQLAAIDSLCQLGDERVIPLARRLLDETRSPVRMDDAGYQMMSGVRSMRSLVMKSLRSSPNPTLRRLGGRFRWPNWLRMRRFSK